MALAAHEPAVFQIAELMGDRRLIERKDTGKIGDEVQARYDSLCEETGLMPDVVFETAYFDEDSGKVQFGDVISCTLTVESGLPGFGGELFAFTMTATESGLSQIYWK